MPIRNRSRFEGFTLVEMLLTLGVVGVLGLALLLVLIKIFTYFCIYKWNQFSGEMKDKVILLTGGTSGIGEVCVRDLFLRGATVVFTGRNGSAVRNEIVPNLVQSLRAKMKKIADGSQEYSALNKEEIEVERSTREGNQEQLLNLLEDTCQKIEVMANQT